MSLRFRKILRKIAQGFGKLTPMQIITGVFLLIILLGSGLLMLPAASKEGSTPFMTALFTATSCTCVTGLALVDTFTHWTIFGQAVMLCLIQIGGLGFMTILTLFLLAMNRRIGFRERSIIAQSFGMDSLHDIVHTVRLILRRTFLIESIGALLLTVRFLFQMPFGKAIWWGIFHSVSAFCNAGFDIMGAVEQGGSLMAYTADITVNLVIVLLIVLGGLGFFVWEDVLHTSNPKKWSVHTKLVLTISGILIFGGAAAFLGMEWNNPQTIGTMPAGEKILASLFQSVTTRTAGFYSISQSGLTDASRALTDILMFIGGSSGSTAGGAKTVTVALLLLSAVATARGHSRVTVFHRTISQEQIRNAAAVVIMMLAAAVAAALILCTTNAMPLSDCLYETVSAIATVGLTTGITPALNAISHILLIILMFFGRVGIMTISLGFLLADPAKERYRYAETKVLVG